MSSILVNLTFRGFLPPEGRANQKLLRESHDKRGGARRLAEPETQILSLTDGRGYLLRHWKRVKIVVFLIFYLMVYRKLF